MKNTDRTFFEGLYGKSSIEFVKGLVYIYPFGVIGKENNNNVKPHIHNNQFQIFLVIQGSTVLLHNDEKIPISAPSFITIPKNTEHGFEHQTEMKGWIISLSDAVLEHMIKRETEAVIAIETFQLTAVTADSFSETVFKNMLECVEEYHQENFGKLLMLESMIGKMIVQLSRIPKSTPLRIFNKDNSSIIYFRRFSQLIRESRTYKKTIEQYAAELNITPGHLNRICSIIAQQNSKEVIIDYFINESKTLLSDIEKSINEVGYSLGFDDPSYFSRLFKKKTGYTPNEFRKNIGVKN
ncbi:MULTISPECIES: AraC family transcriptional regulator [Chryseobacterium]|uniref:Arabinose operon regulatory protein n=1 Tax=Chryseobacterium salivictor TaxID=2547600 RepID=A0A4P6ZG43_9FLAO|nr:MULTISPECIES: AraC family transcriptional regulator [Chryseobacterium]MDQ0477237.1 AraC family transcriptional activator of pobA [Chryseobacterium sp. MDT2-18]QBO58630.1 Arabinose operon regulatory protein [Chryseobacterium salivictor]